MSAAICERDCRKDAASRALMVMLGAAAGFPVPRLAAVQHPLAALKHADLLVAAQPEAAAVVEARRCARSRRREWRSARRRRPGRRRGTARRRSSRGWRSARRPPPPNRPESDPASGPRIACFTESLARSASIEVTRSRMSSLPVFTKVAHRLLGRGEGAGEAVAEVLADGLRVLGVFRQRVGQRIDRGLRRLHAVLGRAAGLLHRGACAAGGLGGVVERVLHGADLHRVEEIAHRIARLDLRMHPLEVLPGRGQIGGIAVVDLRQRRRRGDLAEREAVHSGDLRDEPADGLNEAVHPGQRRGDQLLDAGQHRVRRADHRGAGDQRQRCEQPLHGLDRQPEAIDDRVAGDMHAGDHDVPGGGEPRGDGVDRGLQHRDEPVADRLPDRQRGIAEADGDAGGLADLVPHAGEGHGAGDHGGGRDRMRAGDAEHQPGGLLQRGVARRPGRRRSARSASPAG